MKKKKKKKIMQRLDNQEIASTENVVKIDELKEIIQSLRALLTAPSTPMKV